MYVSKKKRQEPVLKRIPRLYVHIFVVIYGAHAPYNAWGPRRLLRLLPEDPGQAAGQRRDPGIAGLLEADADVSEKIRFIACILWGNALRLKAETQCNNGFARHCCSPSDSFHVIMICSDQSLGIHAWIMYVQLCESI